KTGVSHCPSCHAEITLEQWRPIVDFERTLAKEGPKKGPESPHKPQSPPEVNEAKRRKTARKYKARHRNTWVSIYGGFNLSDRDLTGGRCVLLVLDEMNLSAQTKRPH